MADTVAAPDAAQVVYADMDENGLYEIESLCMNCRDDVS